MGFYLNKIQSSRTCCHNVENFWLGSLRIKTLQCLRCLLRVDVPGLLRQSRLVHAGPLGETDF